MRTRIFPSSEGTVSKEMSKPLSLESSEENSSLWVAEPEASLLLPEVNSTRGLPFCDQSLGKYELKPKEADEGIGAGAGKEKVAGNADWVGIERSVGNAHKRTMRPRLAADDLFGTEGNRGDEGLDEEKVGSMDSTLTGDPCVVEDWAESCALSWSSRLRAAANCARRLSISEQSSGSGLALGSD